MKLLLLLEKILHKYMKIIGFATNGQVKEVLRNEGINPPSVRKVIINQEGFMEVLYHDGSKSTRIETPQFKPKPKEKK